MKHLPGYPGYLQREAFSLTKDVRVHASSVGKLLSMNSVYVHQLEKARSDLAWYFNRSLHRPFNSLLLGPPGSGKSFVARQLADLGPATADDKAGDMLPAREAKKITKVRFFEYNLSQLDRPDDLTGMLQEVAGAKEEPKIVLLDEFDVRIGSSSVIRYLIEPMHDGKFGKAGNKRELGKTAFIFSGSYLSDKALLRKIQQEQSQIDLLKLSFDYYNSPDIKQDNTTSGNAEINSLFHMLDAYRKYQEDIATESHAILYLRQLDKLSDFLSRINGFVIEVPDLSRPLEITDPPLALWTDNCSFDGLGATCFRGDGIAEKVMEWADTERKLSGNLFKSYIAPSEPFLEYKDMLLKERLHIFLTMFDDERKNRREKREPPIGQRWTNDTVVEIKKSLLNYICAAPLVHGMRSLNTLMWNLEAKADQHDGQGREQYALTVRDPEVVSRHVRQEGDYRDPSRLWTLMKKRCGLPIEGDGAVRIALDGRDGKLRIWDPPRGRSSPPAAPR